MVLNPVFLCREETGRGDFPVSAVNPSQRDLSPDTTYPSDRMQIIQKDWQTEGAEPAGGERSLDEKPH